MGVSLHGITGGELRFKVRTVVFKVVSELNRLKVVLYVVLYVVAKHYVECYTEYNHCESNHLVPPGHVLVLPNDGGGRGARLKVKSSVAILTHDIHFTKQLLADLLVLESLKSDVSPEWTRWRVEVLRYHVIDLIEAFGCPLDIALKELFVALGQCFDPLSTFVDPVDAGNCVLKLCLVGGGVVLIVVGIQLLIYECDQVVIKVGENLLTGGSS